MTDATRRAATTRVHESITRWLSDGGPEWLLLDWLRGYDLPVTDVAEPYIWIARSLEAHGDLQSKESLFCKRVAAVLWQALTGRETSSGGARFHNLFMLCGFTYICPKSLARPLQAIYADRPALPVSEGLNVREALRRPWSKTRWIRRL